jgi:acetyl-CoA acyltransferase
VLARTGWSVGDLDAVELNEAFAVQVLACAAPARPGPWRRSTPTAARSRWPRAGQQRLPDGRHAARAGSSASRGTRGLATLCIGVGQGQSLLVERV